MKSLTRNEKCTTAVVAVLTAGICASLLGPTPATAASPSEAERGPRITVENLNVEAADLERGLNLIDEIPEHVLLSGDAALRAWLGEIHPELLRGTQADIVGCAGAIAWLIASTAIPVAKILKIKRLINTLGGVTKAVRVFWGASFSWEKIRALGGAAAALGAELIGVTAVRQKCFS